MLLACCFAQEQQRQQTKTTNERRQRRCDGPQARKPRHGHSQPHRAPGEGDVSTRVMGFDLARSRGPSPGRKPFPRDPLDRLALVRDVMCTATVLSLHADCVHWERLTPTCFESWATFPPQGLRTPNFGERPMVFARSGFERSPFERAPSVLCLRRPVACRHVGPPPSRCCCEPIGGMPLLRDPYCCCALR